jgi:hypothetical protein
LVKGKKIMGISTVVGQPARGEDFFDRPYIIEGLWDRLNSKHNILMVAQRRIGKTSVLFRLLDKPQENIRVIYEITESVDEINDFFWRIYKKVYETLSSTDKFKTLLGNYLKEHSISHVGKDGAKLEYKKGDYHKFLVKLLTAISRDKVRLIILIDEFAQTVENISNKVNEHEAKKFLDLNRELRQNPDTNQNVTFIYAGSIGLENVVGKINHTKGINDLHNYSIPAFTRTEALGLIDKISAGSTYEIPFEVKEYIISRIDFLSPFYIQLIIDEMDQICVRNNVPKALTETVDEAINEAIKNRNHFLNWEERLRRALNGSSLKFAGELLDRLSSLDYINSVDIVNFAVKHGILEEYKGILNMLKHDGYINNDAEPAKYRFNSPILKLWWNRNVAN